MKTLLTIILTISVIFTYSQNKQSLSNDFIPNTTINNKLKILNSQSIKKNLGNQEGKLIEDELPSRMQYSNVSRTSYLILYHLNGANANSFNQFEVGKIEKKGKNYRTTDYNEFISESGVKIGIDMEYLIKIKGKKYTQLIENGFVVLNYEIKGDKKNDFLKRYNMPIYEASYYFKNGKLDKFIFGFPNL